MNPFEVATANYGADLPALRAVRETVFVVEQGVPADIELDALDPACTHVLARDAGGAPIGTGRLAPDGRIGRMAVLRDWRGRGVGRALLSQLFANLEALRVERVETAISPTDARLLAFLARNGFTPAQRLAFVRDVA